MFKFIVQCCAFTIAYHAQTSECKDLRTYVPKVLLENSWNSKQMITEGKAAIPLETTLHAFRNQEKTKQRSTIEFIKQDNLFCNANA